MSVTRDMRRYSQGTVQATTWFFFDRPHVIAALGRKEAKAMSKIGAHGRRIMKTMMRPATTGQPHSTPGQAPKTQVKGLIRKLIFFKYHPLYHSVVIGPTKLRGMNPAIKPIGKRTVMQLLDEGGTARAKKHYVIRDRKKQRIISYSSLAAIKIRKSKTFKNQKNVQKSKRRYHPMVMKAGIKKFKPRPFRALTMAKLLASPRLKSAWSIL